MRLLVLTQTVDKKDSALGFFHYWIDALAERVDSVLVSALNIGEYEEPDNVKVLPIRPWGHRARLRTALRVLKLAWQHRDEYDAVFVHMNQEYVLVAGWLWCLLGKHVYMWRNHYEGNFLTDIAAVFCTRVFYTSKHSYTARFRNSEQMPVGVSVDSCHLDEPIEQKPHSVLFLGRFDQSKHPDLIVEALGNVAKKGLEFTATFVGGPSDPNSPFPNQVQTRAKELSIADRTHFAGPIPNTDTYKFYRSHTIYINAGKSGMLDKSLFKSIACGCLAIFTSNDMEEVVGNEYHFAEGNLEQLTDKLAKTLTLSEEERRTAHKIQHDAAIGQNTLPVLMDRLIIELST